MKRSGFGWRQWLRSFQSHGLAWREVWPVRLVALLTGLMGIINVLSAVTPSLADRLAILREFSPLEVRRGGHLTAALAGFALLLLANSLWRRKRVAWLLTLVVLALSVISHLVKGLDYEEAALATGLGVWLFVLRPHFHARSDTPSIRQGLQVLLAAFLFTLAYGTLGFFLLDRHYHISFSLGAALEQTVVMFTQFYDPGLQPLTGFGRYFANSIYVIGAATLSYALLMLIRPVLVRQPATSAERAHAKAIVETYGRSSLARLTLLDDKSYYFSPGGSMVAYVARADTALALGDPIGPANDIALAIKGFVTFCQSNDWQPAFHETLPDYLEHYQAANLRALHIGYAGVVDLATFTLSGKANQGLRTPMNRMTRQGFRAEIHEPPLCDELLAELHTISDEWLTMVHGTEKRFMLGWFDDDYIRRGRVIAIHTPDGPISAFANIIPEYQRNEVTIDLMRRRPQVENGTMDFLFVSLCEWAKAQGYAGFGLGLSPLWRVGDEEDDPGVERALHYIYENLNQFYNFKGLHEYKEKFHPDWSPRYLIYPGPASLPAVLTTLVRASSGDTFVWDSLKDAAQPLLRWRTSAESLKPSTD